MDKGASLTRYEGPVAVDTAPVTYGLCYNCASLQLLSLGVVKLTAHKVSMSN